MLAWFESSDSRVFMSMLKKTTKMDEKKREFLASGNRATVFWWLAPAFQLLHLTWFMALLACRVWKGLYFSGQREFWWRTKSRLKFDVLKALVQRRIRGWALIDLKISGYKLHRSSGSRFLKVLFNKRIRLWTTWYCKCFEAFFYWSVSKILSSILNKRCNGHLMFRISNWWNALL